MVTTVAFFGGFVGKKVMAKVVAFFLFLLLWSFWSSSLELIINNEMGVF
jgi:hypothetical protein